MKKQNEFFDDMFDDEDRIFSSNTDIELKRKGIYYITGEINSSSLVDIQQDILLKHLDPSWNDDIQLIINSVGGSVAEGYALIDLLEWVKMDVRTTAIGFCASMGTCIACSGTKGKRIITPNTSIMIHGTICGVEGNYNQIAAVSREMLRDHERDIKFWMKHSKYKKKVDIEKHFLHGKYDIYMEPEEAIKHGIFDGICKGNKS